MGGQGAGGIGASSADTTLGAPAQQEMQVHDQVQPAIVHEVLVQADHAGVLQLQQHIHLPAARANMLTLLIAAFASSGLGEGGWSSPVCAPTLCMRWARAVASRKHTHLS